MGTYYSVACHDCKVKRDLDKHYANFGYDVENRKNALQYHEDLKKSNRLGTSLLVSFLQDHIGHNVVYFNEHYESVVQDCEDYEEENFWI